MSIAVFASNGSIKGLYLRKKVSNHIFFLNVLFLGVDLAKIVIKSILLLENAGVQVMGITSDGTSTNRNMWNWMGISAKSQNFINSFENPFDSQHSVYVFSDAPHLLKKIRNRLYTKKKALKVSIRH